MGTLLRKQNTPSNKGKVVTKFNQKSALSERPKLKIWTKEEVEADRSKAYQYAV
jgi:hypothetical protein